MNKRIILGLGSVAAVLAIGGAALLSGIGVTQYSEVTYMTDGPDYKDVTDLTKASTAVAHVRILSAGAAYLIPFDNASAQVAPPRQDDGPKGKAKLETPSIPIPPPGPKGLLKTDYTVEVLDNVRGAGLKKGQHIVVSQIGGRSADGAVVANGEHDPVMVVGDEEVLFLNHDGSNGKFFTTGGGAGRFKVQSSGVVIAVDHGSQVGRIQSGKPASFLKSSVQSVRE
jgi:hypothetical protein